MDQFEPHLPNLMTFMGIGLSLGLVLSKQIDEKIMSPFFFLFNPDIELNLFCNFVFHFLLNKNHHFCLSISILILGKKNSNQLTRLKFD